LCIITSITLTNHEKVNFFNEKYVQVPTSTSKLHNVLIRSGTNIQGPEEQSKKQTYT